MKNKWFINGLIMILAILWFVPFWFVIINALKSYQEVAASKSSLPNDFLGQGIENFMLIMTNEKIKFIKSFVDSIIITGGALLFIVLTSSMAAWVLVRNKSRTSNVIFLIFVASMVIPFQVVMLPLVSWFSDITSLTGIPMTRSYLGMWIVYAGFGSAMSIFMYHGFIKSVPFELEEAARIDGCKPHQVFFKIIFPILKPITMTLIILNGIWIWNDFLLPLVLLGQGNEVQTIPLAISGFIGSFVKQWELIMMALILSIIPIIILFVIGQKQIIKGMVGGSVK